MSSLLNLELIYKLWYIEDGLDYLKKIIISTISKDTISVNL